MKTDELISMLSSGPDAGAPPRPGVPGAALVAGGVLLSCALMAAALGLRPDLAQAARWPAFWLKLAFVGALALVGWLAATRLSKPGARAAALPYLIAAPLLAMWALGAIAMLDAAPAERAQLFWGQTWRSCTALIAMLSLPIFGAVLWVMRRMAPTRLRLAGAAAGFAAGSAAAAVYCLHCPETAPSFVGFWYVLGILAPTALGALIGRRALAW